MQNASPPRPVIVVPYDSRWPLAFAAEARAISTCLGDNLLALHHIGSTSIPGIYAKPIIDMMPVVRDLSVLDQQAPAMKRLGYEAMGEFGIAGRRYFRRDNSAGVRTHHVHAFAENSPHVLRHLAYRDFLRSHPGIAAQYSDLKRMLARQHPTDIEAYMDGKDAFIQDVQSQSLRWIAGPLSDTPSSMTRVTLERLREIECLSPLATDARSDGRRMVDRLIEDWNTGRNQFDQPGEIAYVARHEGAVCAVGGLNRDPYANKPNVGRIRRLYVQTPWRRRGIGALIVRQLLADARGSFNIIQLRTDDPNAVAFYDTLGFARVGGDPECTHRFKINP